MIPDRETPTRVDSPKWNARFRSDAEGLCRRRACHFVEKWLAGLVGMAVYRGRNATNGFAVRPTWFHILSPRIGNVTNEVKLRWRCFRFSPLVPCEAQEDPGKLGERPDPQSGRFGRFLVLMPDLLCELVRTD